LNVNATVVVDLDVRRRSAPVGRPPTDTIERSTRAERRDPVNDNVNGGVQVQVHVKVNVY